MRVLVTGATGHIGSHVVRACLAANVEPVALARPASDRRGLAGLDVEVREGDVLDAAAVSRAMQGVDSVIHVAAVHRNFAARDEELVRPAAEGTRNVLEAAKKAGVRRVVYTSTAATLGFTDDPARPLDETAENTSAKGVYTRAKIEAEKVALAAARGGGVEVVVLNPSGVFGPRDFRLTPATRAVRGLLTGDPAMLAVCMSDVRDVANAHVLALTRGVPGQRYVVTGDLLLPPQLAALMAEVAGVRPSQLRPPKLLLRFLAGQQEKKARKTGEDAGLTRDMVEDAYGRHLAYTSARARSVLGATFRPAAEVLRDAVRWLLFVDALAPAKAARVRRHMGDAAAPDVDWTR